MTRQDFRDGVILTLVALSLLVSAIALSIVCVHQALKGEYHGQEIEQKDYADPR